MKVPSVSVSSGHFSPFIWGSWTGKYFILVFTDDGLAHLWYKQRDGIMGNTEGILQGFVAVAGRKISQGNGQFESRIQWPPVAIGLLYPRSDALQQFKERFWWHPYVVQEVTLTFSLQLRHQIIILSKQHMSLNPGFVPSPSPLPCMYLTSTDE